MTQFRNPTTRSLLANLCLSLWRHPCTGHVSIAHRNISQCSSPPFSPCSLIHYTQATCQNVMLTLGHHTGTVAKRCQFVKLCFNELSVSPSVFFRNSWIYYFVPVRVWSIAISVYVCMYVCLFLKETHVPVYPIFQGIFYCAVDDELCSCNMKMCSYKSQFVQFILLTALNIFGNLLKSKHSLIIRLFTLQLQYINTAAPIAQIHHSSRVWLLTYSSVTVSGIVKTWYWRPSYGLRSITGKKYYEA